MSTLNSTTIRALLNQIDPSVRFHYARSTKTGKPTTIAYRFDDEAREIVYNATKCSKKDTFSRSEGRIKAAGRLALNRARHPNGYIPYEKVSVDGKPRYKLISEALEKLFTTNQE